MRTRFSRKRYTKFNQPQRSATMETRTIKLADFLGWVAAFTRTGGFTSKAESVRTGLPATATQAWNATVAGAFGPLVVAPEDKALADEAAAWARGMDPQTDYDKSLQAVAEADEVTYQTHGTAGSMIHAYQRFVAQQALLKNKGGGGWVGSVGDPWAGEVVIDETKWMSGGYHLVRSRGVVTDYPIVLFQKQLPADLVPGKRVTVAGTIKTCGEHFGRKETTLSRVKLVQDS